VDLGEVSPARYVDPFSLLLAQVATAVRRNPKLAYRFTRYPTK
jgi:hypothetical protein